MCCSPVKLANREFALKNEKYSSIFKKISEISKIYINNLEEIFYIYIKFENGNLIYYWLRK